MKDFGIVESIVGKKAMIKLNKKDQDKNLKNCYFSKNSEDYDILVKNNIKAKENDKVKIEVEKKNY